MTAARIARSKAPRLTRRSSAGDDPARLVAPHPRLITAVKQQLDALSARSFLRTSPVLLLTATPMQNSLAELWGLVQYVEPTGTLLGDITTFRQVFCADDDRTLVPGQEHELQRRLALVLQRTLRRQAQEFLDRPFTQRRCRLYEYEMSNDERSLYDDVTEYLLQPSLYAFAGSQRRLLLIGFHRRMASSIPALAASLQNVAARLRRLKAGKGAAVSTGDLRDLEDEEEIDQASEEQPVPVDRGAVAEELALVEDFITRARSLPHDAKARSFQDAIRVVLELGREGRGSGKAVVFTESITTQEYLRKLLLDMGLGDEDVTLFRGTNDHDRAKQAHARWVEEEGRNLPPGTRPSREVGVRLALVHEFRTRSKVFVCTEAGAKGLNLQFCETVINYDLPWNPQRIEQRIGRCHRYSQQRDVTVVNFIARDNEAHRLTFEILSQKLDLFGKVLDASDHVLHEPRTDAPEIVVSAVSLEFEKICATSTVGRELWTRLRARSLPSGTRSPSGKTRTKRSTSARPRLSSRASTRTCARCSNACARNFLKDFCSWTAISPTLSRDTSAHATSSTPARKLPGAWYSMWQPTPSCQRRLRTCVALQRGTLVA